MIATILFFMAGLRIVMGLLLRCKDVSLFVRLYLSCLMGFIFTADVAVLILVISDGLMFLDHTGFVDVGSSKLLRMLTAGINHIFNRQLLHNVDLRESRIV